MQNIDSASAFNLCLKDSMIAVHLLFHLRLDWDILMFQE